MKKILIGFMILNNLCFGFWGVDKIRDEFGDRVDAIAGVNRDNLDYFLEMGSPSELTIIYFSPKFRTVKNEVITKFKIDDKEPYIVKTKNESTGIMGYYKVEDKNTIKKIVSDFKLGKVVKILIFDDNGQKILITIPLTNFRESYEELVKRRAKG